MQPDIRAALGPGTPRPLAIRDRARRFRRTFAVALAVALGSSALPAASVAAAPPFVAYHGVSGAQHQAEVDRLAPQGYRPESLSVYGDPGSPVYAATWIRRSGHPWVMYHGLTESQYQGLYNAGGPMSQGFVPTIISAVGSGDATRFALVAEKNGRAWSARHGLTQTDLVNETNANFGAGRTLRWVAAYGTPWDTRYAAVWDQGSPTRAYWWVGESGADLESRIQPLIDSGARPQLIIRAPNGSYLSIWYEAHTGSLWAYRELTAGEYQGAFDRAVGAGMFPARVVGSGSGSGARLHAVFTQHEPYLSRAWSVRGASSPNLVKFDTWMRNLMIASRTRNGQLAIVRDGKLLFAHSYTWGESGTRITQNTDRLRIASCSKPITAIATHQEIAAGRLTRTRLLTNLLGMRQPDGSAPADSRVGTINVGHLLTHAGGWDRDASGDLMFQDVEVRDAYRAAAPRRSNCPSPRSTWRATR